MVLVAPVNLPFNIKTLWFDPNGLEINAGDKLIVQTARGLEMGVAAEEVIEVSEESLKKLKSPLKPVVRIADTADIEHAAEMEELGRAAMPVFKELARQTNEDMHPVSVEYLFDGDKAVFYFEAEERVDFRELVRKLAAHFHVRIDMHQIGVRDEARIVGGIAHCGQEVCCKRLGGEFKPVSIRMAKEQDLSLNPQKISGLCGRLMCCLRYEMDAYKDFKSRAPKVGDMIKTPEGDAKVTDYDVPKEVITLKIGEEKPVKIHLADFTLSKDGKPVSVDDEVWDAAHETLDIAFSGSELFSTSQFTGTDKLGSAHAIHHGKSTSGSKDQSKSSKTRSSKRSSSRNDSAGASSYDAPEKKRTKRRRSTTIKGNEKHTEKTTDTSNAEQRNKANSADAGGRSRKNAAKAKGGASGRVVRPGQKSSGLSRQSGKGEGSASSASKQQKKRSDPTKNDAARSSDKGGSKQKSAQGSSSQNASSKRKRRRSHNVAQDNKKAAE